MRPLPRRRIFHAQGAAPAKPSGATERGVADAGNAEQRRLVVGWGEAHSVEHEGVVGFDERAPADAAGRVLRTGALEESLRVPMANGQ